MFLAVVTWFLNLLKSALVCFNGMQEDTSVLNFVKTGRKMAEKSWQEEKKDKKANRQNTGYHRNLEKLYFC
jgi:hypothetical protein